MTPARRRRRRVIRARLPTISHTPVPSTVSRGSGTQSGPTPAEAGSLVELSQGGSRPLQIGKDEQRTFLEDGDTVIFRGWCERPGAVTIGFGELQGRILPALQPSPPPA